MKEVSRRLEIIIQLKLRQLSREKIQNNNKLSRTFDL